MNDSLKPCPFCGCEMKYSEIYEDAVEHPFTRNNRGDCPGYTATEKLSVGAEKWNTRPVEAAAQAREAKYREALEYYAGLLNYQIVTGVEPMPKEIPPNTPKWVRGWDDGAKARAALAEKQP